MQTPDDAETLLPAHDGDAERAPGVDELLRRTAQGDRASFSAFYDATVPWVHGLSTAMFRTSQDAAEATVRSYLSAWEEAPEALLDLSEQDDSADRERRVFAWLSVLAHRVMTGMRRTDRVGTDQAGPQLGPGAGAVALPEDLEGLVDPAAYEAVRLTWLGGLTAEDTARRLGRPVDETRTLLRDGVQQIVSAHRIAHGLRGGRAEVQDPPRPALADTVGDDVAGGRTGELADLSALHALDAAGHTAALAAAQRHGSGELTLWRARVDAARRAVTWAFRGVVAEPSLSLIDELLRRLPPHDADVALVEEHRGPRRPRDRVRPFKVLLLVTLAALVLAAGAWAAWSQFSAPGIQSRVAASSDLYTTSNYPAKGGGTMKGFLSAEQNSGYLMVGGMPQLPAGRTYQVWLHPKDGSVPASLGRYGANDFAGPLTFRGLDRFAAASLTVEPEGGSDVPTSEFLVGMDLDPTATTGPQYGGRPSTDG